MKVEDRFNKVKKEIEESASAVGRSLDEIKIVAVSKGQEITDIKALSNKKIITAFGESRVQNLQDKSEEMPEVGWHMIGHLQRNKVKYLARMKNCTLIHSLDSYRLAKKINKRAGMEDRVMDALVQVNVAKDENKYGIMPEDTIEFVKELTEFDNLKIKGLMTILPHTQNTEELRPYFKEMKQLFLQLEKMAIPEIEMEELSMGMSNDFKVAVEEGATMLRIGTGIFGARNY